MEKLFVYGSLQQSEVQESVLGRVANLRNDILHGFRKGTVKINGTVYPIAIPRADSRIVGKVLEVTPKEITMIDKYETVAYRRVMVVLESGESSWVYCQP